MREANQNPMPTPANPVGPVVRQESLGSLLGDLMRHSTSLIKSEVELVRSEVSRKIHLYQTAILITVIGLFLALLAGMALLAAGVIALASYVGPVEAALIGGAVIGIVAAGLLSKGVGRLKRLTI